MFLCKSTRSGAGTDIDGIETTRQIKAVSPTTQVIVLTSYSEDERIFPAIKAGALSYLLKDVGPDELVRAIKAAWRGEATLHSTVAARLMHELTGGRASPLDDLTEREREVLALIARGMSNVEIANQLIIGQRTVKTHVSNILQRFSNCLSLHLICRWLCKASAILNSDS